MSCSKEPTSIERSFNNIFQTVRNIDKMIWDYCGSSPGFTKDEIKETIRELRDCIDNLEKDLDEE